jgi:hypothetical protein
VPLVDYGREGNWMLISSGAGIMMAIMDAEPRFRWCVDIDGIRDTRRFVRWAQWAEHFVGRVAVAGWFSLTDPALLRSAVISLRVPPPRGRAAVGSLPKCTRTKDSRISLKTRVQSVKMA